MDSNSMIPIVFIIFFWVWVVWAILDWRKAKFKHSLQHKLVDKFNTAPELNDFLQSDGGNKFLSFLTAGGKGLLQKLLSSIYKGVIFCLLGVACLIINPIMAVETEGSKVFTAIGIVGIALGIGFLVSTFISYKLSEKWGIMDTENNG